MFLQRELPNYAAILIRALHWKMFFSAKMYHKIYCPSPRCKLQARQLNSIQREYEYQWMDKEYLKVCVKAMYRLLVLKWTIKHMQLTQIEIKAIVCGMKDEDIREWSEKYLASKRKTKMLEKWRFISQHNLPLARYTWPSEAPTSLTRLKNAFSRGLQNRPLWRRDFFQIGNKNKSDRAKSGEYGERGSSS